MPQRIYNLHRTGSEIVFPLSSLCFRHHDNFLNLCILSDFDIVQMYIGRYSKLVYVKQYNLCFSLATIQFVLFTYLIRYSLATQFTALHYKYTLKKPSLVSLALRAAPSARS